MTHRKYISEFGLNMFLKKTMVLQQSELNRVAEYKYFNEDNPCHIYFICKRKRILIDPKEFYVDNENIIFKFRVQQQDTLEDFGIKVPNSLGTTNIKLISNYPYNYFELFKDDKLYLRGYPAVLLQTFETELCNYLDLLVLYIGQSYGVEGSRTAPERLQSHSTLQGIYSEAIKNNPDSEIWLILTSFDQFLLSSFDGRIKVSEEEYEKDTEHLKRVTNTVLHDGLKEQQVINFTEAALIRYFQPPYNIEYKDTFPNPAHSTYSECYRLDINSISIELNTESIKCRLFSSAILPTIHHIKTFPLHSEDDRKGMFDF